jgi:chromate transporter
MVDEDYAALLAVSQILPGGNTLNACVMIGDRFRRIPGAVAALTGLMAMPIAILISLAWLYDRFAGIPLVRAAMLGAGAAAAGLVAGTGLKMARGLQIRPVTFAIAAAVLLAIGVLRLSLIGSVLVLAPLSVGLALLSRPR